MIAPPARVRCGDMKGTLQKKAVARTGKLLKVIEDSALACQTCASFREDDPDIYYCEDQQADFPALCERYRQAEHLAPLRTEWGVPDE